MDNMHDKELIDSLREQNRLLSEQNEMLRELIDKTPDRNTVDRNFSRQQEQLDVIVKAQKVDYTWSWIKFILAALAAIVVIYFVVRAWLYFRNITGTFTEYMESINSTFGNMEGSLSEFMKSIESTFGDMESSFSNIQKFFDNLGGIFKF